MCLILGPFSTSASLLYGARWLPDTLFVKSLISLNRRERVRFNLELLGLFCYLCVAYKKGRRVPMYGDSNFVKETYVFSRGDSRIKFWR